MNSETCFETLLCSAPAFVQPTPSVILPLEIEFAASRGLKVAPIRGLSRFVSAPRIQLGYQTADIVQLRTFASRFLICNWSMATDGVVVFEYNHAHASHSLSELCDCDWENWRNTLQFRCGVRRFFLFRHSGQKLRNLGPRSVGLRLHSGSAMVQIPPSRYLAGARFEWLDTTAAIEEIPWWLVDEAGDAGGSRPAAAPSVLPYAVARELRNGTNAFTL